eukprot:TRINITY_DN53315_c0_g2_i1.p1 TRINITY_DN53315_c0_g2~~TRINITY_DN53315_c0_g2_i1.p1  ORF type:complete len:593 (-),score=73.63 TRINITY_DN53315_c0_g2_i1:349-2127(-)
MLGQNLSGNAIRRMSSELPPDLMRGVSSDRALQGYGKHWKGTAGGPEDYLLSEATHHIDDFISHDWRTSRVVKYLTLSYIYNAKAACIGSTLFAGLAVLVKEVLRHAGHVARSHPGEAPLADVIAFTTIGPAVYLMLLLHWQSIRARFGRRTIMFVDKLCISQDDEDKKSQGIFGLAAFLKISRRIVVLWSPQYFSRLWCTYELAAWFRMERELSTVTFVPVDIPPRFLCVLALVATASLHYYLEMLYGTGTQLIYIALVFVCWLITAYAIQGQAWQAEELRQQLKNFDIQASCCYCCSNEHVHPETGAPLACDRKIVYSTLRQWTKKSLSAEDGHLKAFNKEVKTTLRQYVTTCLPERRLFIRYSDMVHSCAPNCWLILDVLLLRLNTGVDATRIGMSLVEGACAWFLTVPLSMALVIRMIYKADRLREFATGSKRRQVFLACCLWGPVGFASHILLWACIRADVYYTTNMPWLQLVAAAVNVLLGFYVFANNPESKLSGRSFSLGTRTLTVSRGSIFTAAAKSTFEMFSRGAGTNAAKVHINHDVGPANIQLDSIADSSCSSHSSEGEPALAPVIPYDAWRSNPKCTEDT